MNSAHSSLIVAGRLIRTLLLLAFVAPYVSAHQDEKPTQAPATVPKTSSKPRPEGSEHPPASGTDKKRDAKAADPRGHSASEGSIQDTTSKADRQGRSQNVRPDDAKNPRSAQSSKPGDSGNPRRRNGQRPATPERNDGRNADPGSPREASVSAPGRPRTDTHANSRESRSNKPGRPGASTDAPVRSGSPGKPSDHPLSSSNRPGRRGSPTKPSERPDQPRNGGEKNGSPNSKPNIPKGGPARTTGADDTVIARDKDGRTTSVSTPRGTTVRMDGRGRVISIRDKSGNTISRGPGGERRIETVRADRSRVVSLGHGGGYVERSFDRGGRQYLRRTYVVGGRTYVHVYRGHYYHGVPYYVYVPPYYYAPAYYGWIYNPWPRPVYYTWGWYGSAWYRPYGYYFVPHPAYPYASLWLTDYLLAENLRLAYEAGANENYRAGSNEAGMILSAYHPTGQTQGNRPNGDYVVLKPEVKQMVADEVKAVIAEEQKAATTSFDSSQPTSANKLPPAFDPNHRVFVVFSVLQVNVKGETCSLTPSDILKRLEDTPDKENTVAVQILASKTSDCAMGSSARMQVTDLNDMQNHLREQVDAGIRILSEKQGKDGLPTAPAANPRAVPEGTAATDATAAADLQKQQQEADQTEKEVQQDAAPDSGDVQ
jgi:YD repeat-containing protein